MENYNKIIESLTVRYIKSRHLRILKPLVIENFFDVENTLIYLKKGDIRYGDNQVAKEGSILFIPAGRMTNLSYNAQNSEQITFDQFKDNKEAFFELSRDPALKGMKEPNYLYLNFEAKIFESVNFFSSLDIPPFVITNCQVLLDIMFDTFKEEVTKDTAGRERVIKNNTERVVIEILRYILSNKLFVEQLATNTTYFKDPRLVSIFGYIKANLAGDLSNKALAQIAQVSEDYVGQYFKMLTGINPQDYIEYQRMEEAVNLLRTSKLSIREIGQEVGYKGTAYFCRRFKMMFGIPAGKMRRRESLMDV